MTLARDLCRQAHDSIQQRRKYDGSPYWTHPEAVAETLSEVSDDEDILIAAFAHDTQEDVAPINPQYNLLWLRENFGERVTRLVEELTDKYTKEAYPHLNRAKRKALECERVAAASAAAKTIKLADLINNTESIVAHDKDFARVYLREAMDTLGILSDGNPVLLQRLSMQLLAGFASLGLTIPMIGA